MFKKTNLFPEGGAAAGIGLSPGNGRAWRRALAGSIVVFWVVMMTLLLQREFFSPRHLRGYAPFMNRDALLRDRWLSIYLQSQPIGYIHSTTEPYTSLAGVPGYVMSTTTVVQAAVLGARMNVQVTTRAVLNYDYQLDNFEFTLRSGQYSLEVTGLEAGGVLTVQAVTPGGKVTRRIPVPPQEGIIFASMFSPVHAFGDVRQGARHQIMAFNPLSMELERMTVQVEQRQEFEWQGERIPGYVVRSGYRGAEQIAWVDEDGEIISVQAGMGWALRRERFESMAAVFAALDAAPADIAALVSVPLDKSYVPEQYQRLIIFLRGLSSAPPENQRQQVLSYTDAGVRLEISREQPVSSAPVLPLAEPADYLRDDLHVQSTHPDIVRTARTIVGQEPDAWQAARLINRWVHEQVEKTPVASVPSALDILRTRRGDCNEHTVLFTALARSVGIPTRMHVGLALMNGRLYYHAWPSVFVGAWIDMDPTFGQDVADVFHICLLAGEVQSHFDIAAIIGNVTATVEELL